MEIDRHKNKDRINGTKQSTKERVKKKNDDEYRKVRESYQKNEEIERLSNCSWHSWNVDMIKLPVRIPNSNKTKW